MTLSTIQKQTLAAALVLVAVTWWAATSPQSPIRPDPRLDRPVLQFLGKVARVAAKLGLAALWFAEPAPQDLDEMQLVRSTVGLDGHQLLDNRRW